MGEPGTTPTSVAVNVAGGASFPGITTSRQGSAKSNYWYDVLNDAPSVALLNHEATRVNDAFTTWS